MSSKTHPTFISLGNESVKISNIKHYGTDKIRTKHSKGHFPDFMMAFGDEVCNYNHIDSVKLLSAPVYLQKIYCSNKKKEKYRDSGKFRIINEEIASKILSGNERRIIYTLSGFFARGYKISDTLNEIAPKDDLLTIINQGIHVRFINGYYDDDGGGFVGKSWERIYFSTGETWSKESTGISDSWTKISSIKNFDIEAKYDEFNSIWEREYLFVTTYQNDNFVFYEGNAGFDIHAKKRELDEILT